MREGRRGLTIAVVIALVVALLVWWRSRPDERVASAPAATPNVAAIEAAPASGVPASPSPSLPDADRLRAALEDYQRIAIYPPWSRPHEEGTAYKLTWNEPVVSDLPFLERGDRILHFRFAADRAHVMFGESLTSWIEVWEGEDRKRRVPARVVQGWVMAIGGGASQGRRVTLQYRDDGKGGDPVAGDRRYGNRFIPSEHDELAETQQVQLFAEVEVEGERRVIAREFTYSPRPVLEIRSVRDAIRDGSLVVTLAVEVHEPGLHTIEANVMSSDGEVPIGYVDTSTTLSAGATTVDLVFFGKMFRETRLDGPYLVRDLRGFRRDIEGGQNLWWSDARTHTTAAHRSAAFSDAAWDSDEKREKIRRFQNLIDQSRP